MIDVNSDPKIFGETPDRKSQYVGLDALKDVHISFNGYGVAEGEKVTFPTQEQVDAAPKRFFKTMKATPTSQNKSAFCKVERQMPGKAARTSWLNLSVLTRQALDEYGNRIDAIDNFRAEMSEFNDDAERVSHLLGKTIVGTGTISGYRRVFDRDTHKPTDQVEECNYVTIDYVEEPAPAKPKRNS